MDWGKTYGDTPSSTPQHYVHLVLTQFRRTNVASLFLACIDPHWYSRDVFLPRWSKDVLLYDFHKPLDACFDSIPEKKTDTNSELYRILVVCKKRDLLGTTQAEGTYWKDLHVPLWKTLLLTAAITRNRGFPPSLCSKTNVFSLCSRVHELTHYVSSFTYSVFTPFVHSPSSLSLKLQLP